MTTTRHDKMLVRAIQVGLGAVFVGLWYLGSERGWIDPFFFSCPANVAARVWQLFSRGTIWPHLGTTLLEAFLAFVLGGTLGIAFGFLLTYSTLLGSVLGPYVRFANSVPRILLAPVFLLWLGLGIWSKVALGVTVVFFIVFFTTYEALREVPVILIDSVRMLGATPWQLTRHVSIPSALGLILSSLHVSAGFAVVAVVFGEYLGSSRGIGYLTAQAEGNLDSTGLFACIVILSTSVTLLSEVVVLVERQATVWMPESRGGGVKGSFDKLRQV